MTLDLLLLLVERRGQLVQRSEIVDRLWGKDVFVDVETGIHTAIRKIRRALHDSPDAPIFVETVPGKGYRFIATVEVVGAPHDATGSGKTQPPVAPQLSDSVLPEPLPAQASTLSIGEASFGIDRAVLGTASELAASATAVMPVEPTVAVPVASAARMRLTLGLVVAALLIGVGIWSRLPRGENSRSSPLTLAVLPFTNLSGDPTHEYGAEGLAEDTATSLGQIDPEQMGVVAGSATVRYKGSTKSAAEIGRELAADYIVESSLRIEDKRLRVTATLVRVRDQVQVCPLAAVLDEIDGQS